MGKVIALQGFVSGVMAAIVAPSVVPAIAAIVYSGAPRSLNYALSTTVGLYGLLSVVTIFWVLRSVRSWVATHHEGL